MQLAWARCQQCWAQAEDKMRKRPDGPPRSLLPSAAAPPSPSATHGPTRMKWSDSVKFMQNGDAVLVSADDDKHHLDMRVNHQELQHGDGHHPTQKTLPNTYDSANGIYLQQSHSRTSSPAHPSKRQFFHESPERFEYRQQHLATAVDPSTLNSTSLFDIQWSMDARQPVQWETARRVNEGYGSPLSDQAMQIQSPEPLAGQCTGTFAYNP